MAFHSSDTSSQCRSRINEVFISPLYSLTMGGDSAKKKKKKSSSVPQSSSPVSASSPPMRVTNNINIPVRQQIAWAKANKRLFSGVSDSKSVTNTKRFKQENAKREEEEYTEINYHATKPPALFVDGYNIIGHINSVEGRDISLDDARDCLISDLCILCGATGWWIEVVFDAYQTMGPEKKESIDNLIITYTSKEETADNHIERRFAELRADGFRNMVVATDDITLRMIAGSNGAGYLPASFLLEEFRIAYRGWDTAKEDLDREVFLNKPKLGNLKLSDELKDAMELLRQRESNLRQNERKGDLDGASP